MTAPRTPEEIALELGERIEYGHEPTSEIVLAIAAALRAERETALEEAARVADDHVTYCCAKMYYFYKEREEWLWSHAAGESEVIAKRIRARKCNNSSE